MKHSQIKAIKAKQARQYLMVKKDWDNLRPIQRTSLLEMSLSDDQKNDEAIHETLEHIKMKKFDELNPPLKKSVIWQIGARYE